MKKRKKNCWRYHHFRHVYQKPQLYEVQFLRYRVRQFFFVILGHFLPFTPLPSPNNPGNQNFEKMKKAFGDVIILNLCSKKHDQMMYGYSGMECNRDIFCHFRPFFSFTPLLTLKIKIWKKYKSTWRYYPFTHAHRRSRSYDVLFLRYKVQRTKFFVILDHFLFFDPPNNPKNENFVKIKKSLEIL